MEDKQHREGYTLEMTTITENAIKGKWNGDIERPIVSVRCLTYNQARYIATTIESFLMQETTFPFEIVIHDDASTDGTTEIVKEYADKFPNIIVPIFETQNLYSSNHELLTKKVNERIRGRYVAYCEGDDYWTDKYKLQKQYEAMESNPEINICAHAVKKVKASTKEDCGIVSPARENCIIPVKSVIEGGGEFVGTNSLFIRKEALEQEYQFRKMLRYDYTLQVNCSLENGMLYLADCMSAYRVMADNSWSVRIKKDKEYYAQVRAAWSKMLDQLDIDTKGKYHESVENYRLRFEIDSLIVSQEYKKLRKNEYLSYYRKLNGIQKYKYYIKVRFPKLFATIKNAVQ